MVVSVTNGGVIDAGLLPHIFDAFRSGARNAAAGSGASEGLGLGLYITRELVTLHDGTVEATSSPERGITTFTASGRCTPTAAASTAIIVIISIIIETTKTT